MGFHIYANNINTQNPVAYNKKYNKIRHEEERLVKCPVEELFESLYFAKLENWEFGKVLVSHDLPNQIKKTKTTKLDMW